MTNVQCAITECDHCDDDGMHPGYGICNLETLFINSIGLCVNTMPPPAREENL